MFRLQKYNIIGLDIILAQQVLALSLTACSREGGSDTYC